MKQPRKATLTPLTVRIMASEHEPEKLSGKVKPEETPEEPLGGDDVNETLPDVISDPGVEGGVDVVNEEPEDPESEA